MTNLQLPLSKETIYKLRDIHIEMSKAFGTYQNCVNCEHMENGKVCDLYNVTPPPHVIVKGCDKWLETIPF